MESEWIRRERQRELEAAWSRASLSPEQKASLRRVDQGLVRRGITVRTRERYVKEGSKLGRFLGKPFEEASRRDLEGYVDCVAASCAPGTVEATKQFVKAFYKALLRPDEPGHPEVVRWIRLRQPKAGSVAASNLLTKRDMETLLEAATSSRDRALVMVLYDSAARVSELLGLRVGDVAFDQYGARITLNGKTGARRIRIINSVPALQAWLSDHPKRQEPDAPMWVASRKRGQWNPIGAVALRGILRRLADAAMLGKRIHPHLFRHTRLTELARVLSESELKVYAGWTGSSTMARIYIHLSGEDVDDKLLQHAGLVKDKSAREEVLSVQVCTRCHERNTDLAQFCQRCTLPLDERTALEWAQQQELLRKNLAKLVQIAEAERGIGC